MNRILASIFILTGLLFSCVERGKPIKKEEAKTTTKSSKKKVDHYTCPKGHKGSDTQGTCSECSSVLVHNQAFHGSGNLAIPQPKINDPFSSTPAANNTPSPAQNAYGDYHYICPNGHVGGSGTAGNCTSCEATLTHNQLYHK